MQTNNKRIAKNAVMLTLRSLLVAIVGLYTSRIVLEALGVQDFGIYGVIGGIVGLASFLNGSMAGATSRFLTFELGTGDEEKLKNIFVTSIRIHFYLALIVMILAETVGLWFLNYKMVIPENRMFAANVLYQFTVLSILVSFTQVPYNAAIIAHEKMNIYAYFEIIFVILKLVIVYILLLVDNSRLILYGSLTFGVTVINALFYRGYCIRHFQETKLTGKFSKELAKPMLKFSGLDLYGNMCVTAKNQGQPLLLNLFFGVIANAGASIALTVTGTIQALTTTVSQAFRPQIIKQYANNEIRQMQVMMRRSVQFTLFALSCLIIPIIIETPNILQLWLGQIPSYSVSFLRFILIACFINTINQTSNAAVHATGHIKIISFYGGSMFILGIICSYLLFKLGFPAYTLYIVDIGMYILTISISIFSLNKQIEKFKTLDYIFSIIRSSLGLIATLITTYFIKQEVVNSYFFSENEPSNIWNSLLSLGIITLISIFVLSILSFLFVFSKSEKEIIISKFKFMLVKVKNKLIRKKCLC